MRKTISKLAKSLKLPKHLQDNSMRDAILSFLKDTKKTFNVFFILIIVIVLWIMYIGESFENPSSKQRIHVTETPRPAYSSPTPLPLDLLTATATSTPQ